MQNLNVEFENAGGEKLSGILDLPTTTTQAYALFAHCFTCSKNLKAANNISSAMTDAGIAVLRFDFTGLGQSEGDFANANFSSNVSDLRAAADFLETHRVEHDKIHAEDCVDCDRVDGKIDAFRRKISFDGDLSEREIKRLLEIADRCPVHKTLHNEIKIRTTLA